LKGGRVRRGRVPPLDRVVAGGVAYSAKKKGGGNLGGVAETEKEMNGSAAVEPEGRAEKLRTGIAAGLSILKNGTRRKGGR